MSRLVTAKVRSGVVVADDFARLPEGLSVQVVVPDDEPAQISDADEDELLDRMAEAERGDTLITADEVMRDLAARRAARAR